MYLELRNELDQILIGQELAEQLKVAPTALNYQIEEPNERQFGLLATNVAFIFSKKLKERENKIVSPQLIAGAIGKLLSKDKFQVSIDGGGFINLNPTKEFVRDYLTSEPQELNLKIDVDWNSNNIQEKIRVSEEARTFLNELGKRQTELSRDDSLQLLSIVGDSEIDSRPYLKGFGGRENTPNYILKFEEALKQVPAPKEIPRLEDLNPITEKLLLFRGRLEESISREHPERVMTLILKLIRDFFSEYNRPSTRRLILERKESPFYFRAMSCGKQVLGALNSLKFSCQLPPTVL